MGHNRKPYPDCAYMPSIDEDDAPEEAPVAAIPEKAASTIKISYKTESGEINKGMYYELKVPYEMTDAKVEVFVSEGPAKGKIKVDSASGITRGVYLTVPEPGIYKVKCTYENVEIPGSPITVKVVNPEHPEYK